MADSTLPDQLGAVAGYASAATTGNPWLGLAGGALAGALLSLVYAALTVTARAYQFAGGLAVWMLGFGLAPNGRRTGQAKRSPARGGINGGTAGVAWAASWVASLCKPSAVGQLPLAVG